MNLEILLGVAMFTAVVLALVAFILAARAKLVSSGLVTIDINGEKKYHCSSRGQTFVDFIQCWIVFSVCLRGWRYMRSM